MRKIFRAAVVGFAIGAALFFVPFIFRFVLFAVLIGFVMRAFSWRSRWHHAARWHRFHSHYGQGQYDNTAIPIDGKWYRPGMQQGGSINDIPLS